MKNNNKITTQSSTVEKLLAVLPKNCNCNTCIVTKNYIESILGKEKYKRLSKEVGVFN